MNLDYVADLKISSKLVTERKIHNFRILAFQTLTYGRN